MKYAELEVTKLKPCGWNPDSRIEVEAGHINRLKKSIEEYGMLEPIKVLSDHTIIDGHRRYQVALLLNIREVPVLIYTDKANAKDIYSQVNWAVRPLEGVEHIEVYLKGGPVPAEDQLKLIEEVVERFGVSMLRSMAKNKVGARAYVIVRRFVELHSNIPDSGQEEAVRSVLQWAIRHRAGRRLENAMREGIEAEDLWRFINKDKPFRLTKKWTLEEK